MPYCKEFAAMFNNPEGDVSVTSLFSRINLSYEDLKPHLVRFDCSQTDLLLNKIFDRYTLQNKIVRPFHLGLGNPNASILIVGKELAIEPARSSPDQLSSTQCSTNNYYKKLFVNEAILNYLLWWHKVKGNKIPPNCCIQDPQFPSSFCHLYNREKSNGHYWAKINKVIGSLLGRNEKNTVAFQANAYEDSFFSHVFLTELHDMPSLQSPTYPKQPALLKKLNDLPNIPFYRKFSRIVFACRTYLEEHVPKFRDELQRSYGVKPVTWAGLPTRNIKEVFESDRQRIIICSNLAGPAGWTNDELELLACLLG